MDGRPAQPSRKRTGDPGTGTPRGSTFWTVTQTCWRLFLLKYILALFPVKTPDYLHVGTLYHALLEGWSVEGLYTFPPEYHPHIELAKKLYDERLAGPPIPSSTAKEKQRTLPFGMTAKADREELSFGKRKAIRDFKSTIFFSEHDEKQWNVNLGILAEAMGHGAEKAIVDVICKAGGDNFGRVQQFEVEVGEREREAVEQLVNDARLEIHARVDEACSELNKYEVCGQDGNKPKDDHQKALLYKRLRAIFPKRMPSCVGKYGPCHYYERCWGDGPEKHLFKQNQRKGYAWVNDEGDVVLRDKVSRLSDAYVGVV
ncbi:MAG: hypothetical protein EPN91_08285 [Salinibacterium sp.]|nr:MAG: hypothetical protein EPN91_08285 [Salinibacterium sp.]